MWSGKRARGRRLIRAKRRAFGLAPQLVRRSCINHASYRRALAQTARQARQAGNTNSQVRAFLNSRP